MDNFEIYTYLKARKNGGSHEPVATSPALRLMDWEGTILKEYTAEQVATLATLPTPSSLNANVDRELLTFQGYNWSISDIKAWVSAHEGQCLTVGAIYTTTDGEDHNYWNNPRINTSESISMLKKGTTSIGDNAFNGCYSLTNTNIPDGVTIIGSSAFRSCYSLTSVNIPNGVTNISPSAFYNCYSLTNINIPDGVTYIGGYTFYNCYSLTNINIPNGVTIISTSAFNGCYSLTNINIPNGVTNIGTSAFNGCYSLTNINIPDGVTTIGNNVFYNCYSLTNINIPNGVTNIGTNAFSNCRFLTDIVVKGTPSLADTNTFSNIYSGYLIYVPRAKLSWYSTATNWTTLYNNGKIVAIEDNAEYLESIGIDV